MDYPGCKGFVDDLISEASAEFSLTSASVSLVRYFITEYVNLICASRRGLMMVVTHCVRTHRNGSTRCVSWWMHWLRSWTAKVWT